MSRQSITKAPLKFSVSQLDKIISSILNNVFNKKFIGNVNKLFTYGISENSFKTDYEKEVRVYIIRRLCDVILSNMLDSKETVLDYLDLEGKHKDASTQILNDLIDVHVVENELLLIDSMISNQLRYLTLDNKADSLVDLITNLKAENYEDLNEHISKLTGSIDEISRTLRDARESLLDDKYDINLSDVNFVGVLDNIIKTNKMTTNKVKLGLRALNDMFNGGLEKGRVYCAFAVAKGWKSGFLLNSALWAKKYNTFQTKDPKKKPVVLYLTMENTVKETIERMWSHSFGNDSKIESYDPDTASRMLNESGIFTPEDDSSAQIAIKYKPNASISTQDLYGIVEDISKEGGEVVLLVLDYLKRIKSSKVEKELRLELGKITNELTVFAKDLEIPVLTAMQLNRGAFDAIEDADTFEKKLSVINKLGASQIGESIDIIQNVDYGFIINRIRNTKLDEGGFVTFDDRFLTLKLIASRGKDPKIVSFKHRFQDNNDMALVEDINHERSLSTFNDEEIIRGVVDESEKKVFSSYGGRKLRK